MLVHHPGSERAHHWNPSHMYLSNILPFTVLPERKTKWVRKRAQYNMNSINIYLKRGVDWITVNNTHWEVTLFEVGPVIITMPSNAGSSAPAVNSIIHYRQDGKKGCHMTWASQTLEWGEGTNLIKPVNSMKSSYSHWKNSSTLSFNLSVSSEFAK